MGIYSIWCAQPRQTNTTPSPLVHWITGILKSARQWDWQEGVGYITLFERHVFGTSHYLKDNHLTRAQRSAMAKMRCGVAPIRLETGRYEGLTEQEWICPVCHMDEIESEIHVMIFCPLYNDIRAWTMKA